MPPISTQTPESFLFSLVFRGIADWRRGLRLWRRKAQDHQGSDYQRVLTVGTHEKEEDLFFSLQGGGSANDRHQGDGLTNSKVRASRCTEKRGKKKMLSMAFGAWHFILLLSVSSTPGEEWHLNLPTLLGKEHLTSNMPALHHHLTIYHQRIGDAKSPPSSSPHAAH